MGACPARGTGSQGGRYSVMPGTPCSEKDSVGMETRADSCRERSSLRSQKRRVSQENLSEMPSRLTGSQQPQLWAMLFCQEDCGSSGRAGGAPAGVPGGEEGKLSMDGHTGA